MLIERVGLQGIIVAARVFVSHTRRDIDFSNVFDSACARVGIDAFRSEFEDIKLPAWQTIRDEIRRSRALFLLIGKELVKAQASRDSNWAYTQNWIAFEIGVACEIGIDVWVLCDDVAVNFPVPYLNNYLPVTLRRREAFDILVNDLKKYERGMKSNFPDKRILVECPYSNCKAIFNFPVKSTNHVKIKCPQCLRRFSLNQGYTGAGARTAEKETGKICRIVNRGGDKSG